MNQNGKNGARSEREARYLSRVEIENIRSIGRLVWEAAPAPGWNVVLGDNGSGKTTFARAIAYALVPPNERAALRAGAAFWFRDRGESEGRIVVEWKAEDLPIAASTIHFKPTDAGHAMWEGPLTESANPLFVAGFGPFRRFSGGDPDREKQFSGFPAAARVVSLFEESHSFTESLAWLKLLRFKEAAGDAASAPESSRLLSSIRAFVNQDGFLPNEARLDRITPDHVVFIDGNGADVPIEDLSDGYRSILSLTFELIRQLAWHQGVEQVFDASSTRIVAPGIVLIDEVDAHLHPTWQRRIGPLLRGAFPLVQFIVTTHSPLVCQAADTIYHLPRPGTDEEGHPVAGGELDRLRYGDLADAYGTLAMGVVGRSESAHAMLERLSSLNRKELDAGLTDEETAEQRRLRRVFGAGPLPEKQA